MAKVGAIINGWKNYLINDPVVDEIAKQRAKACLSCDKIRHGGVAILMKDYNLKEIEGYYCGVCQCPLSTATRSENHKCPEDLWPK